jgi:hypothetical protein
MLNTSPKTEAPCHSGRLGRDHMDGQGHRTNCAEHSPDRHDGALLDESPAGRERASQQPGARQRSQVARPALECPELDEQSSPLKGPAANPEVDESLEVNHAHSTP